MIGVTGEVALVLARELLRALAFPVHVLCYLPRRRAWQTRAAQALANATVAPATNPPPAGDLRGKHVFLSVGEASGEQHALGLLSAVAAHGPSPRWSMFGSARLAQAGGTLLFPLSEHAIFGLAGVVRSLPFLVRACARFVRLLREDPPDLVVLVDYPGFHLILGRLARKHGVKVLHYVAPQYWAWAPWRLARYRRCVDVSLTILPFEPAFFAAVGVRSAYVGHPLVDHLAATPLDATTLAAARAQPTVCMLPGSRSSEIRANIPAFVRLGRALRRDHPRLRLVVVHVEPRKADLIRELLAHESNDQLELHVGPLAPWLAGARVVLAKSGTGSLEACLHGTPTVVVYRLRGPLAAWGYRRFVTVPWIAAANLIAGRRVVPELVFAGQDGWVEVERALRALLVDGAQRAECLAGLAEVRNRLGCSGASQRAAGWIRGLV